MLCYDKNNLQNKQQRLNYIYSRDLFIPANQNQRRIRDRRWLKLSVSQIWNSIRPSRAFSACRSDQFECRWSGDHGENIIKDIWNGDGCDLEFMAVACLGQVLLWVTYRLAPRGYYGYYYNFTIALHFSVFFFLISTALLLPRLQVRWSHKSGPKKLVIVRTRTFRIFYKYSLSICTTIISPEGPWRDEMHHWTLVGGDSNLI